MNSRAQYFSEWASPDFTEPNGVALLLACSRSPSCRGCAAARSPGPISLLIGLAALWAVYSLRTVPVAACMLAPLAAAALQAVAGPAAPGLRAASGR